MNVYYAMLSVMGMMIAFLSFAYVVVRRERLRAANQSTD